jgi:hypothetical protein
MMIPKLLILPAALLFVVLPYAQLTAAQNLAADATVTASSQLNASYPPENVIDGVISDASRWLSADSPETQWLMLEMPEARTIGGFALHSGWQTDDAVFQVFVEERQDGEWEMVPSSLVDHNNSTELLVVFDYEITTDALRFVFEEGGIHDDIVRVREIIVYAPGDEPTLGRTPVDEIDPEQPVILVNQSGYNLACNSSS